MRAGKVQIPVLLFSSLPELYLAELAKSSGATAYLRKSLGPDRLCVAVAALAKCLSNIAPPSPYLRLVRT
jgi:hypothetical protein